MKVLGCILLIMAILSTIFYLGLNKFIIGEYKSNKHKEIFQLIVTFIAFEVIFVAVLTYLGISLVV